VFAFGAPIKVAGSLSLLVSIPTVVIGIARYARRGSYADRSALRDTVAPMGVGSVIGAVIGGLLVGLVSPAASRSIATRCSINRSRRATVGSVTAEVSSPRSEFTRALTVFAGRS